MQDLQESLGWEDPLEEGIATHSSILPWRIPSTEEPGGLQSIGLQRVRLKRLSMHVSHSEQSAAPLYPKRGDGKWGADAHNRETREIYELGTQSGPNLG